MSFTFLPPSLRALMWMLVLVCLCACMKSGYALAEGKQINNQNKKEKHYLSLFYYHLLLHPVHY